MKVLITAATNLELAEIEKKQISNSNLVTHYEVTGVGMIATTFHLMDKVHQQHFDLMIQIGIAGTFDHQLSLGEAVVVTSESTAEMGVIENNEYKDIFSLRLANPNEHPYKNGSLTNLHQDLLLACNLPFVNAVTVNQISTQDAIINRYKNTYNASIESMEGAAFHYVGLMKKVPFIQIRGISNYVGERNKKNWNINEAIQSSTAACWNLLQQF